MKKENKQLDKKNDSRANKLWFVLETKTGRF